MAQRTGVSPTCPTPALVLALGQLGVKVAGDVESILRRGDRRRAAVSRFLALAHASSGGLGLIPLRDARSDVALDPRTRRQAAQDVINGATFLRARLEGVLRELHTHERLIAAGLGDTLAPPLDLFVVADLTSPAGAGAIIPMVVLLGDLIGGMPEGKGHLLLNMADPSRAASGEKSEALTYVTLKELDVLLDPGQVGGRQALAQAMGLAGETQQPLQVYLFGDRKEGTREVKDHRELRVILGNFLLALLSGGLAQRLAERLPAPEVAESRAFYAGGAATALLFEPKPLIYACAGRLGAEFIAAEMEPGLKPDAQEAEHRAKAMMDTLGDLRTWMQDLRADTPCEVRAEVDGVHLGLHFTGFHFERVPREEWSEAIASHSLLFQQTKLPRQRKAIRQNAVSLRQGTGAALDRAIEDLPQIARLYPGGLQTALLALQKVDEELEDRIAALAVGPRQAPVCAEVKREALDGAAWNFPDLPAFVARLLILCVVQFYVLGTIGVSTDQPAWLTWAIAVLACATTTGACILWLQRKDQHLINLRDQLVRDSEQRYAAMLEAVARDQMTIVCCRLRDQVGMAMADLSRLGKTLALVQEQLGNLWAIYAPPAGHEHIRHSLFRPPPADASFTEAIYRRWRPGPEEMRQALLRHQRLLRGWRDLECDAVTRRLVLYGCQAFAPIRNLTLGDVVRHHSNGGAKGLFRMLAREAVPLLRPDFDRLGGGGYVQNAQYLLVADPHSSEFTEGLADILPGWDVISTGDPYTATCCRVQQLVPLLALRKLLHRGRTEYDRLEPAEQRELCTIEW